MKALGWIFIVLGVLDFIVGIIGITNGYEGGGRSIGGGIWVGVLGAYLIHRAKQKQQEREDQEKWSND